MVIDLEEPYSSLYRKGYLRISKDGRKRVDLFNNDKDRTTISYARYIMSVSLGYVLSKDYEVDHIDRDKTNDDISNLQVLTVSEHKQKNSKEMTTGRTCTIVVCENCGKDLLRETSTLRYKTYYCNNYCREAKQRLDAMDGDFVSALRYYKHNNIPRSKEFGLMAISERFGVSRKRMRRYIKKYGLGEL